MHSHLVGWLGARREVVLFYALAPLVSSPLLVFSDYESGDPVRIARALAALYLPFIAIPLAIIFVQRSVLPRIQRGLEQPGQRLELRTLSPISALFRAGHRVRLAVGGADADTFGPAAQGWRTHCTRAS